VQRVRRAVNPPGDARDDLSIIRDLSNAMGYPMAYRSEEQVFAEFATLWPAMGGITYERIKTRGIQWPCPAQDHPGTEYLYKDGFPKVKVPFVPVTFNPPAEVTSGAYPFILTTGRNLYQYHSGSMTRRVVAIEEHAGEAYVELNPADGKRLGIKAGDSVIVRSKRGEVEIKARITKRVSEGTVFIPMHYREAAANVITNDALDPVVKIPELKVCAVNVVRVEKPEQEPAGAGR
jgi:predicted molibdopterin-dependent oxidoreductase YjgC